MRTTLAEDAQISPEGSGYFKDPDGHLWEVAHNPLFWVGPKDCDAEEGR